MYPSGTGVKLKHQGGFSGQASDSQCGRHRPLVSAVAIQGGAVMVTDVFGDQIVNSGNLKLLLTKMNDY